MKFISLVVSITALIGFSAFAETETASMAGGGTSTMSQSDLSGGMMKKVYADFLTTYHGPTLQKFGPYSQTGQGQLDPNALTGFDSEANIAWKLDSTGEVGIGPVIPFVWQPNLQRNEQFVMGNAGLKFFNKHVVKTESTQVAANIYMQAPTSNDAHVRNMNFEVQAEPWIIYDMPNTHVRLGSWTTFSYFNGVTDGLAFKAYVQPYVAYKLSDKLAVQLAYETEGDHFIGQSPLVFQNVLSDFQPGLVWNVIPGTKINPYLLLFPAQHLATNTTGVGVVFYSQML